MRIIRKHLLPISINHDVCTISLPEGARVLYVAPSPYRSEGAVLFVEEDNAKPASNHIFLTFKVDGDMVPEGMAYVGTVKKDNDYFHLYVDQYYVAMPLMVNQKGQAIAQVDFRGDLQLDPQLHHSKEVLP